MRTHQLTTIVCASSSHGNTRRIAEEMADVLDAAVIDPERVDPEQLLASDLVGFGSGVYGWRLHRGLLNLIRRLPRTGGAAFVFATSGFAPAGLQRYFTVPVRLLEAQGSEVVGTFECRGWDTSVPFNAVRGIRKGHPDRTDLEAARTFAEGLRDRVRER